MAERGGGCGRLIARSRLDTFKAEQPDFLPNLTAELSKRNLSADAQARITRSVRKAGG